MDQGREASGEDDAAQLPLISVERSAALAERDPDLVGTAGVTQENRAFVLDQLAGAAGEDGRSAGETCALLLAFASVLSQKFVS